LNFEEVRSQWPSDPVPEVFIYNNTIQQQLLLISPE
jgi:hypothetical protein